MLWSLDCCALIDHAGDALDLDGKRAAPSVSGRLLDVENWRLTVGFLGLVILLAVGSAVSQHGAPEPGSSAALGRQTVDMMTSDGGALMFGRQ